MNRFNSLFALALLLLSAATLEAQYFYTSHYYPATTYYRPTTVYYGTSPTTVYYGAPPVTSYYRPLVGRGITRVGYYAPPVAYPAAPSYYAYYPWW